MRSLVRLKRFEDNPFSLFSEFEKDLSQVFSYGKKENLPEGFTPRCELFHDEKHLVLSLDVPGVKKDDINIEVKDNSLTVTGERKHEMKQSHYSEMSYGKFKRSIELPSDIDESLIEAKFESGVLSIAVPKKEAPQPKKIEINSGEKKGILSKILSSKQEEK